MKNVINILLIVLIIAHLIGRWNEGRPTRMQAIEQLQSIDELSATNEAFFEDYKGGLISLQYYKARKKELQFKIDSINAIENPYKTQ